MTRMTRILSLAAVALAVACNDQALPTDPGSGMTVAASMTSLTDSSGPTIVTDKDDYIPHEPVLMIGTGWEPEEAVVLTLAEDPEIHEDRTFTVNADTLGYFEFNDFAPEEHHAGVRFVLTAVGQTSGVQAQTTFTDAVAEGGFSAQSNGGGGVNASQLMLSAPAVSPGDLLIAQITVAQGISTTQICPVQTGWTSEIKTNFETQIVQQIFWRVATANQAVFSYTWQFRSNSCTGGLQNRGASGGVIRYTGVNVGNPIDAISVGSSGSSSGPFRAPAITTQTDGAQVIRFFGAFKNIDITGAQTRIYRVGSSNQSTVRTAAAFHATKSSAGDALHFDATFESSAEWVAQTVALRMAVSCAAPAITGQPASVSKIAGESAIFSVTATGTGLTYQWRKNGVAIGSATNASYTIPSVAATDAGSYDVVVTGACGTPVTSDAATLIVTQRSTNTAVTSSPDPSVFGQSVTFEATVSPTSGSGTPTGSVNFIEGGTCASPTTTHASGVALGSGEASFNTGSLSVGPHTITACYSGNTEFAGSFGNVQHTVNKANQTITFNALADKTYGDPPFLVSATATSGLDVSFALGAGSVGCSVSGATVTITAATGTNQYCIIVASQAGNADYNAALPVTRQFAIAKANLSLSVDDKTRTYGQANPVLTGTLTGVVYNDGITATYSTTATQASAVGNYPITATLRDPNNKLGNYNVPSPLPQGELEITRAPLTVTAENKQKDYDGQPFALFTVEYLGFVLGQDESVLGGTLSFTGNAVGAVNAGSYTITPGGLTSSNYAITYGNGTLTINKVSLSVTAVDREKVFDGLPYSFNTNRVTTTDVAYSGFVNSEGPPVLTGTLGFSATSATAVGTYTNTPSGLGATNYDISYVSGTLKILAWTLTGFYQPVDMSTGGMVWNTVKGGSTVPLKFNVYQATTADATKERTDVGAVQSFIASPVACNGSTADQIEFTTTGGTSLRYDVVDRQFIQNWQTPRAPGACYRVTMTTLDGSKLEAYFRLK